MADRPAPPTSLVIVPAAVAAAMMAPDLRRSLVPARDRARALAESLRAASTRPDELPAPDEVLTETVRRRPDAPGGGPTMS